MSITTPPFIREGATFGLVSPAGKIDPEVVPRAEKFLAYNGFRSRRAAHADSQHYQFSAADSDRAADMQLMLDDPKIDVIWCCRGGYGSSRVIDKLDFSSMAKHPKWIVGYSDITVFHSTLSGLYNTTSIHGPMPVNLPENTRDEGPEWTHLLNLLQGKEVTIKTDEDPFNISGTAKGRLIGGNMSLLAAMRGTPYDFDPAGKILFIEEVGEQIYHLDRMMQNLKTGGKLEGLAGIIIGHLTNMQDNTTPFGLSAKGVIHEKVHPLGIPVLFGFPAGHEKPNEPLLMGGQIEMEVNSRGGIVRMNH
ncbi:MAG: S66 peptidase family protein [Bacteroidota bacterium]